MADGSRLTNTVLNIELKPVPKTRLSNITLQVEYKPLPKSRLTNIVLQVEYAEKTGANDSSSASAFINGIGIVSTSDSRSVFLRGKNDLQASISAFLKGVGRATDNKSVFLAAIYAGYDSRAAFLTGIATQSDTVAVFLEGILKSDSSVSAYLTGILRYSSSAFLSGNIATSSSANSLLIGISEAVQSSKSTYMMGVLRNSISAYTNGKITRVDYIWLKTSDLSIAKKFKVLSQGYDDGTIEKSETVNKTISGGVDIAIGESYTTWDMIIMVKVEDVDDFGTLSDLEALYSLNNPNGTPSNIITFVDHRGYEHKVTMVGDMKKNLSGSTVEGRTALYFYRLKLEKTL